MDKYIVRLPEGMREQIAESAKANNRSMNAEIVARLAKSFNPISDDADVLQAVRAISAYSAQFGTSVSVEFSAARDTILENAIKSGYLPADATLADLENPGPAIARLAAQRDAEERHQVSLGHGAPVGTPPRRQRTKST